MRLLRWWCERMRLFRWRDGGGGGFRAAESGEWVVSDCYRLGFHAFCARSARVASNFFRRLVVLEAVNWRSPTWRAAPTCRIACAKARHASCSRWLLSAPALFSYMANRPQSKHNNLRCINRRGACSTSSPAAILLITAGMAKPTAVAVAVEDADADANSNEKSQCQQYHLATSPPHALLVTIIWTATTHHPHPTCCSA